MRIEGMPVSTLLEKRADTRRHEQIEGGVIAEYLYAGRGRTA
jgi:hypothetical protein